MAYRSLMVRNALLLQSLSPKATNCSYASGEDIDLQVRVLGLGADTDNRNTIDMVGLQSPTSPSSPHGRSPETNHQAALDGHI